MSLAIAPVQRGRIIGYSVHSQPMNQLQTISRLASRAEHDATLRELMRHHYSQPAR
ncbi:hypothetical protein APY04_0815 [Hyphomicrobium sulfonivorans]|uniref:Uncharacterized protein n=1 Tax=Hyphomicrobium sulfonivorans TaxID=121290 RepID=A0A120CXC9_HYPSL|nr:hypothetical protein APY04_0815 [Hyphomicrobium sulfonivorans]